MQNNLHLKSFTILLEYSRVLTFSSIAWFHQYYSDFQSVIWKTFEIISAEWNKTRNTCYSTMKDRNAQTNEWLLSSPNGNKTPMLRFKCVHFLFLISRFLKWKSKPREPRGYDNRGFFLLQMFRARRAPGRSAGEAAAHDVQNLPDRHEINQRTPAVARLHRGRFVFISTLNLNISINHMVTIFYHL